MIRHNYINNDNLWKRRFENPCQEKSAVIRSNSSTREVRIEKIISVYKRLFTARRSVHRNWLLGKYVTITKNIVNDVYYYTMDSKRIVLVLGCYYTVNFRSSIKILNRWSMQSECVLVSPN